MDWASEDHPAERAADGAAAAAFAAAVAFAAWSLAVATGPTTALAAAAFLLAYALLRQVPVEQSSFALPNFELMPVEPPQAGELLLTRRHDGHPVETNALLLEDRLALDPDSRVIRLFDPRRAPTSGDFQASIARPSDWISPGSASRDASEALSAALAELRRSLR